MIDPSKQERFLIDADTSRHFAEPGGVTRKALGAFLKGRGYLIFDVEDELKEAAKKYPSIKFAVQSFLNEWPDDQRVSLPPALQLKLNDLQHALRMPGEHINEHRGERAMMLYATEAEPADDWIFLSGDSGAREDAANPPYNLKVMGTRDLVIEMVCSGALKKADGWRVWKAAKGSQAAYEADLGKRCPGAE